MCVILAWLLELWVGMTLRQIVASKPMPTSLIHCYETLMTLLCCSWGL